MQGIQLLLTPFVWVLMLFYELFDNYGVALILFAVLVKVILFPLSIKAKRSMIQMNMLNGQMQKLQKMYGNNRDKYNLEVQKLYEKEKVNPMGGCLWSLLPLVILWPLYAIIRQPLTYLMNLTPDVISEVAQVVNWSTEAVAKGWITQAADFTNVGYNQLYLASLITPDNIRPSRPWPRAPGSSTSTSWASTWPRCPSGSSGPGAAWTGPTSACSCCPSCPPSPA